MTALNETHGQKHVTNKPGDQLPVLGWLIEVQPIDCIRIVEHEPGDLERHAVVAVIPLRFPIVPFEFVIAHTILVCRITSKPQAAPHAAGIHR